MPKGARKPVNLPRHVIRFPSGGKQYGAKEFIEIFSKKANLWQPGMVINEKEGKFTVLTQDGKAPKLPPDAIRANPAIIGASAPPAAAAPAGDAAGGGGGGAADPALLQRVTDLEAQLKQAQDDLAVEKAARAKAETQLSQAQSAPAAASASASPPASGGQGNPKFIELQKKQGQLKDLSSQQGALVDEIIKLQGELFAAGLIEAAEE